MKVRKDAPQVHQTRATRQSGKVQTLGLSKRNELVTGSRGAEDEAKPPSDLGPHVNIRLAIAFGESTPLR